MTHTNGIESFRSMLKRACDGTVHRIGYKFLQQYVDEHSGQYSVRDMDTADQMAHLAAGMVGKRLTYRKLTSEEPYSQAQ